ncbi:MAG: response regulator [Bacteroidales bacterium]|nr:response regulator [Bacteroidales bacterium]
MLLFFVKDTGFGINDQEKELIFERFKQAGMGSRKKEGTGLGLAISKGLVELMGGNIWVKSEPGSGSVFYFTLPISEPETQPYFLSSELKHNGYHTSWENQKILLVEDEEANYVYVYELLSESGLNLLHAKTGEEAVSICKNNNDIALVLMDIRLPGINGIEAMNKIRVFHPKLPVIAQTAFAMENEREFCLNAGCNDYISKPFDQVGLFNLLERFLIKKSKV